MEQLADDEVRLWWTTVGELDGRREEYERLLTDEELARMRRFTFERGQREFLATRVLERSVLSRHAAVARQAWRFRPGAHGRPEIDAPRPIPAVAYNLSNTDGMVICAVAVPPLEVGADVEHLDRRTNLAVADSHFAPAEVAALRGLAPAAQPRRFLDYWTLKESYIKARGLGLKIPLDQFAFDLTDGAPVRVRFDPRLGDDASQWEFHQVEPLPGYLAALAVRRAPGTRITISVEKMDLGQVAGR
jgi:4'-phosphopantetheinyl transferase